MCFANDILSLRFNSLLNQATLEFIRVALAMLVLVMEGKDGKAACRTLGNSNKAIGAIV